MKKKHDPERNNLIVGSPAHDCWQLLEKVNPGKNWFETSPEGKAQSLPILQVSPTDAPSRIIHGLRSIPCLEFQRIRRTGNGTRASHQGSALTLKFREPVALPVGLGYAAHFGLGLFVPGIDSMTTLDRA